MARKRTVILPPFSSAPAKPGANLKVTDGATTVDPTTELDFTSGATVTDLGGGTAGVSVGGTQDYELLYQQVLGSASPTIDTGANAIPATKTNLRIIVLAQTDDTGSGIDNCPFYFNGDTGNNYSAQIFVASGTSIVGAEADSSIVSCFIRIANGSPTVLSYLMLDMFDYTNTSYIKLGQFYNYVQPPANFLQGGIWWAGLGAINQFQLVARPGGVNFVAGASVRVYGY